MICESDHTGGGAPLDTSNKFAIGARGGKVVELAPAAEMSPADAAVKAAWLVMISGRRDLFDRACEEIAKT